MKQQAIRGGMITSASQVILFILRLSSIMILARMLIPEHFGLIGMVTALTVLIERFQDIGLGDAIVQKKEITHEQVSNLFWINLGICIFFTILVALSAKAVAWFYNDHRLIWITIAFAGNFIFSGLVIQHKALIRRRMRFDHFAMISIFSTAFGLGVGIILAWLGYGYWALVWKEIARSLVVTILAWSFCPWRPSLPVRNAGIGSMLKFGGNITGYNMLFYLTNNLDTILLGKFYGAVPVGLYSRAKQLTAMPANQLLEPIKYVSFSGLSALQNDPIKYLSYYEKMLAVVSFLYMPIIVYIAIYSYPIVHIALGSQWMTAVPILRLIAISMYPLSVVKFMGIIMLSTGKSTRYFIWGSITNGFTVLSFVAFIRWGTIGIAASWILSAYINLIFSLFFVFKGSHVSVVSTMRNVYKPLIASIVMGVMLLLTYRFFSTFHIASHMTLSLLLGTSTYLAIWLFFPGGYGNLIEFASYPLSVLKRKKRTILNATQ